MSQGNFNQVPKTAMDHNKLALVGERINGSKGDPKFVLQVINNNPRIKVYPNLEGEDKPIVGKLDIHGAFAFLNALEEAVKNPNFDKAIWELKDHKFFDNKRSPEPMVEAKLIVGRDNGVVYVALTAPKRPVLKFNLRFTDYVRPVNPDGSPLDPVAESEKAGLAYARGVSRLLAVVIGTNYVPPKPREDKGGKGWGNNNGGSKGGWGNSNSGGGFGGGSSGGFDDELAFS